MGRTQAAADGTKNNRDGAKRQIVTPRTRLMARSPRVSLEELQHSRSWDRELAELAARICDVFGGQTLAEAYVRVLQQAPELPAALVDPRLAAVVPPGSDAKFIDGAESAAALKAELRTLLRPH
jgi:hypothetical protein